MRSTLLTGFPGASDGKEFAFNAGDLCLIPRLERFPEEGNGYPIQYSCLENSHRQRSLTGYNTVYGVTKKSDMTEET